MKFRQPLLLHLVADVVARWLELVHFVIVEAEVLEIIKAFILSRQVFDFEALYILHFVRALYHHLPLIQEALQAAST